MITFGSSEQFALEFGTFRPGGNPHNVKAGALGEKARATDETFKTGDPGIGEYLACEGGQGIGSNADFGFTSFTARGIERTDASPSQRK